MPRTPKPAIPPGVQREDRRVAPRLRPEDVPWITEVAPVTGESARLLNISTTGLLLETTARLEPGRHATMVIVTEPDRRQQVEGQVVRTELVSIARSGELIYRTAMSFAHDLDLRSPGARPSAMDDISCVQPQLDGPLSASWKSPHGSRKVKVTHVTITGCYVLSPGAGNVEEPASVTIIFPGRSLTLTGKVAAVEADRGFLLQFEPLLPDTRRALRLEICEGIARGAAAPPQPVAVGKLVAIREAASVTVQMPSRRGTVHASQW